MDIDRAGTNRWTERVFCSECSKRNNSWTVHRIDTARLDDVCVAVDRSVSHVRAVVRRDRFSRSIRQSVASRPVDPISTTPRTFPDRSHWGSRDFRPWKSILSGGTWTLGNASGQKRFNWIVIHLIGDFIWKRTRTSRSEWEREKGSARKKIVLNRMRERWKTNRWLWLSNHSEEGVGHPRMALASWTLG